MHCRQQVGKVKRLKFNIAADFHRSYQRNNWYLFCSCLQQYSPDWGCPWGDQRGAPLRAGCAWLREVVEKSGGLLARRLLSHIIDEHFTSPQQSNSGVMSSLTDQSQWEFPLSKSSSCYLREAEGSGLPGISQDKTHSCWQVFVSMQRAGVQKTTRICHRVVSTWTRTLGGETGASWAGISQHLCRWAQGEQSRSIREQVHTNNSRTFLHTLQVKCRINSHRMLWQSIDGFRKMIQHCRGWIRKNVLNLVVWMQLMPWEVFKSPMASG